MPPPDHPIDDPDRTRPSDPDRTVPSEARPLGPDEGSAGARIALPASIGNYTILAKLGEGGMGIVYEAEQQSPKRKVALKVVRGGRLVTDASIKMFQREAETLGRLKHPGIGAIHESGRTEAGEHFFAMELVRGETLDEHIRGRGADLGREEIRYRLDLFGKICEAVNYAHQRGVIHRDLKPSNIILGEGGVPKILDFGLARITDTDTEAASVVTEIGAIKGTLPYMSPEQTRGDPDEIDVRTDVYSLGVILYQLLSGRRPYDTTKSSILEAMRVIRDESPTSFRSVATVSKLAGGDLETIVRKALEKEPDHRYQSAAALSDDIDRHLRNQPIVARPPTMRYLAGKFVRRYRTGVAAAGTLVFALAAFAVTATLQARSVARARDEAEDQAAKAEAMNTFLSDMLKSPDPWAGGDQDITVAETLDAAVREVGEAFADQPLVESEMRAVLGNTYVGLGRVASAEEQMSHALEIRTRMLGADHPEVADLWMKMAKVRRRNTNPDGAIEAAREAVRIRAVEHDVPHKDIVDAWIALASDLYWASRIAEAESVLALSKATLASIDGDFREIRSRIHFVEAGIAREYGRDTAAGDSLAALALEDLRAVKPDSPTIGLGLNDLALGRLRRGDLESARELFQEALEFTERRLGTDHPEYAKILENSGQVDFREKRYDDVMATLETVREIRARNLGEEHINVIRTRLNMASVAGSAGRNDKALETYEELIPLLRKARGEGHMDVAVATMNRGRSLRRLQRYGEAEASFREAEDLFESLESPALVAQCRMELAIGRKEQGRLPGAEGLLLQAFPVLLEVHGDKHWLVKKAAGELVVVYEGLGQLAKANEYRTFAEEQDGG